MAMTLMVSTNELQNIAKEFRNIAVEQEALRQRTRALLNTLNNAWQGRTATEYSDQLTFIINDEQEKVQLINLLADEISKVVEQMVSCDADMASQILKQFRS